MDETKEQNEMNEEEKLEKEMNGEESPKNENEMNGEESSSNDAESEKTESSDQADAGDGTEEEGAKEEENGGEALGVRLEQIEAELEETKNRLLRVQADYENFRRRTKLEREAEAKYRAQRLVEELLPVIDNFERALSVEANDEQSKSILKGVEMVYNQLKEALSKEGVEEIQAQGEKFDPNKHQAVMQAHSEDHESGMVLEVLQKGYLLKDKVIRPAMVKVSE